MSLSPAHAGVMEWDRGRADLMISEVQHFPQKPVVGETLTFTVFVRNEGAKTAENVTVKIKDHRGTEKSEMIRYIPAGSSQSVFLRLTADESHTARDPHHFIFMVDPEDSIPETDENNNIFFKHLLVSLPSHRDLIVSGVRVTPEDPEAGGLVVFVVTVKNLGSSVADHVKVVVRDQEGWANYGFISRIPADDKKDITISLRADKAHSASNPHNFVVSIDPDNAVAELNEDNNLHAVSTPINVARAEISKPKIPDMEPASRTPFWAQWMFQEKEPEKEKKVVAKKTLPAEQKTQALTTRTEREKDGKEEEIPLAEAYMPPAAVIPAVPAATEKLYFDLEDQIDAIEGSPDMFQKSEVESALQQLIEEARSHGVYTKTELGTHFSRWYQYSHNRYHRENTLKALDKLKRDLNIAGPKSVRAELKEIETQMTPRDVEVESREEISAVIELAGEPFQKGSGLTEDEEELKDLLEDLLTIPIVSPVEVMQNTVEVFDRMAIRYGISESDSIVSNAKSILDMGSFYDSGTFYKRFRFRRLMSEIAEWEENIADKIQTYSFRFPDDTSEENVAKYKKKVIVLSKAFEDRMLDVDLILRLQMEVVQEAEKVFLE